MSAPLARLRADFNRVTADRLESGAWSPDDVAMCNASIQKALKDGDHDLLGCWAKWFADLAAFVPTKEPEGIKGDDLVVGPMRTDRKKKDDWL